MVENRFFLEDTDLSPIVADINTPLKESESVIDKILNSAMFEDYDEARARSSDEDEIAMLTRNDGMRQAASDKGAGKSIVQQLY